MNQKEITLISMQIKKRFWFLSTDLHLQEDGTGTLAFSCKKSTDDGILFSISKWEKEKMMVVVIHWEKKFDFSFKEFFFRHIFSYIEKLKEFNLCKSIYVATNSEKAYESLHEYLPFSYEKIDHLSYVDKWKKFIPTCDNQNFFIKNIEPNFSESIVTLYETLHDILEQLSVENPTLSYAFIENDYGTPFHKSYSFSSFALYIGNKKEPCSISFEETGISFSSSFGAFFASTTQQLKKYLHELIEKKLKKHISPKLTNEYYRFIKGYIKDEEIQKNIYETLLSKYKTNEIEEIVQNVRIESFVHYFNSCVFQLADNYFILQEKNVWMFSSFQKEEALFKLKELMLK